MKNYSKFKTTKGYIRSVTKALTPEITKRYRATEKRLAEEFDAVRQTPATTAQIQKEFREQVELSYNRLQKQKKIRAKGKGKKFSTKHDINIAIESALRSGKFADPAELFGQNVIKTLKDAGAWNEFRKMVHSANYALHGKTKFEAIDPRSFKPAGSHSKFGQKVRYKDLVEINLVWSPAAVELTNLGTGVTAQFESENKEKEAE